MTSSAIANLQKLIGTPRDGALLRFSLGNEYMKAGDRDNAVLHLREAVSRDAGYSAAWKLLGKALADSGRLEQALAAYREGIAAAERKGDRQAEREMTVFARRVEKQLQAQGDR
jgi:Flp pilus assembly protein TadD